MREILFKAKRVDNGEWIEGFYCADSLYDNYFIGVPLNDINRPPFKFYEVNPDTLCQFTGLTDKEGSKIWENDIVDLSDCRWCSFGPAGYDSPIVLVEWNEENCGFHPFANYDCDCDIYYDAKDVKAIGSKFDIPELLKGDN